MQVLTRFTEDKHIPMPEQTLTVQYTIYKAAMQACEPIDTLQTSSTAYLAPQHVYYSGVTGPTKADVPLSWALALVRRSLYTVSSHGLASDSFYRY